MTIRISDLNIQTAKDNLSWIRLTHFLVSHVIHESSDEQLETLEFVKNISSF